MQLRAAETPAGFKVVYTVLKAGFPIGEMVTSLKREKNGRYVYESVTQPTGVVAMFLKDILTERSVIRITKHGVQPLSFLYKQTGKKKRNVTLEFDWKKKQVKNSVNGDVWKMKLPVGTLDKQVYRYALMRDLQNGKTNMQYPIADGGVLKTYLFSVISTKKLETNIGTLDVTVVKRDRKDKPPLYLWCAPKLDFLPVKVQQYKKKQGKITLKIKSVEGFANFKPPKSATN